ncbi:unnamed protein product, partial [Discosporangium mesarthrocarpum]
HEDDFVYCPPSAASAFSSTFSSNSSVTSFDSSGSCPSLTLGRISLTGRIIPLQGPPSPSSCCPSTLIASPAPDHVVGAGGKGEEEKEDQQQPQHKTAVAGGVPDDVGEGEGEEEGDDTRAGAGTATTTTCGPHGPRAPGKPALSPLSSALLTPERKLQLRARARNLRVGFGGETTVLVAAVSGKGEDETVETNKTNETVTTERTGDTSKTDETAEITRAGGAGKADNGRLSSLSLTVVPEKGRTTAEECGVYDGQSNL